MTSLLIKICCFALALPVLGDLTAREIIDTQTARHRLRYETTVMKVILTDDNGVSEERELRRMESNPGDQAVKSLAVFDAPGDIEGTATMTWQHADRANDQWIYFPSQRRLQRIAQGQRSGYFMGMDFTYEDMDPEDIDHYSYELQDEETIDGQPCYVIDAVPATEKIRRSSGYSRRRLYIRKDIIFTVRICYFDRRGKPVKTLNNRELVSVSEEVWRANRTVVDNTAKSHQTDVRVESRDARTELPDSVFSERHLRSGRYRR